VTQIRLQSGYCIDTCALIDFGESYFQDIFPGLWGDMERLAIDGLLIAPTEVYKEIARTYDGEIQRWTRQHKEMFIELDDEQIREVKAIEKRFGNLIDPDKTIPDADPFLIALAKSRGNWTVVTQEKPSTKLKPKIPDVCQILGIPCVNLYNFFKKCDWKY